jgi:hypothetical protein
MSKPAEKWQRESLRLWVNKYAEVKNWLAKLQAKEKSAFDFWRFCEWCGKTPTELLALKSNPASRDAEKLVDSFVTAELPFTNAVKVNMVTAVKSFFKYNYCDLARACGVITLEKVKPYNKPTKEGLRKMWTRTLNLRDKALLTFTCSTAIAKETLTELQWSDLEDNWESKDLPCVNVPSEKLKGHNVGRYKGVRQITFLTPEAKRDLINYKDWIEQKLERKLTAEDHIFLETREPFEPVTYGRLGTLIYKLSRTSAVKFSWHDSRRWVNTALEEIQINPNWARKIRGRKVRGEEAPYSQPAIEQLRAKFREAVSALEFTSETQAISKELDERIKALEKFKAGLTPEQLADAKRAGVLMRKKERVSEPPKEAKEPKDCEDGGHCGGDEDCNEDKFKEVSEGELLQHLKEGWEITYRLQNGRVILKRA